MSLNPLVYFESLLARSSSDVLTTARSCGYPPIGIRLRLRISRFANSYITCDGGLHTDACRGNVTWHAGAQ